MFNCFRKILKIVTTVLSTGPNSSPILNGRLKIIFKAKLIIDGKHVEILELPSPFLCALIQENCGPDINNTEKNKYEKDLEVEVEEYFDISDDAEEDFDIGDIEKDPKKL